MFAALQAYAAPENRLGIERLYEVWGWSEDSRGSLYVAVTPELPAGMHTGEVASEQATLCGYFYKVQGYLAAGTRSHGSPSVAPLIIGRIERRSTPTAVLARPSELWLTGAGLVLATSFVWLLSHRPLFRFRHRQPLAPLAPNMAAKLDAWLDDSTFPGCVNRTRLLVAGVGNMSAGVGDCSAGCGSSSAFWNQIGRPPDTRFVGQNGGTPVQQRRQTGAAAEGLIGVDDGG